MNKITYTYEEENSEQITIEDFFNKFEFYKIIYNEDFKDLIEVVEQCDKTIWLLFEDDTCSWTETYFKEKNDRYSLIERTNKK